LYHHIVLYLAGTIDTTATVISPNLYCCCFTSWELFWWMLFEIDTNRIKQFHVALPGFICWCIGSKKAKDRISLLS